MAAVLLLLPSVACLMGTAPALPLRLPLALRASFGLVHGARRSGVALRFMERVRPTQALREGGVEPDLPEDSSESFATAGEDQEDSFPWGVADGAHTWHGGDNGTFWGEVQKEIKDVGGPTGIQAVISWLFLPGLFVGLSFHLKEEYMFLYTALFIFAFIGMELTKPVKESNFLPEIYRSEEET
eukprot:c22931_g1_i1 orf=130-681(+)